MREPSVDVGGQGADRTATFMADTGATTGGDVLALLQRPRNYDAGELHARGGMGEILRTQDRNISRTVAMKVMHRGAVTQENTLRFIDEARITGRLEHPNIVPVHEAGVNERGEVFYTMKFVKGTTLKQVLKGLVDGDTGARRQYPLPVLLTVFQKVCDAVAFAHSRGVIHRDLKPENIMLGDYGEVLVMDWGLAKVLGNSESHRPTTPSPHSPSSSLIASARNESGDSATKAGMVLGTPRYMAPEQARGETDRLDTRCDIYALGAILYELLTLRAAIAGATAEEIMANVRSGNILPITPALQHSIPSSLAAVAIKSLSLRPEDRYATVPDLQQEIARYQNGFATSAENAGLGRQIALLVRRNKGIALTAAVAWLVITALAGWFVINVTREKDRAEQALADLKKTAPTFCEQARALTEAQKFPDALDKIDTAIALDPEQAGFHAQRGNILQSLGRFADAAAAFRTGMNLDAAFPDAAANLALSEQLSASSDGHRDAAGVAALYGAMKRQGRVGEALALAVRLKLSAEEQLPVWRSRMRSWVGREDVIHLDPDGQLSLSLAHTPISTLEPLRGIPLRKIKLQQVALRDLTALSALPLEDLEIAEADLVDLGPLKGLPLKRLCIPGNPRLADLSPLRGMPLVYLNLLGTSVTDLTPLQGMPLENLLISVAKQLRDIRPLAGLPLDWLVLEETGVADLAPLKGSRIRRLSLYGSPHIRSLEPLSSCSRLEEVCLPPNATNVAVLRAHPALKIVASRPAANQTMAAEDTAERFWAEFERKAARTGDAAAALADARRQILAGGIPARAVTVLTAFEDDTLKVVIRDDKTVTSAESLAGLPLREVHLLSTSISNVSPLAGGRLLTCVLNRSPVADITPLSTCPIRDLSLQETGITTLEAVRSMPLSRISFVGTAVTDVSPLLACTNLEIVCLSKMATNIHLLRSLPQLKYVGYSQGGAPLHLPETTAQEFWTHFEAHGSAGGLKPEVIEPANLAIRAALRKMGVAETNVAAISLTGDGTLNLSGLPISDLAFVRGLPVKTLVLHCTKVRDLAPLRGLPLEGLMLYETPVADLSPLRDSVALRRLEIGKTQVDRLDHILHLELAVLLIGRTRIRDVAPLARMTTLEEILLPEPAENVASLRSLPRLRRISTVYDPTAGQVARSAVQFWAEYDAKQNK